MTLVHQPNAHQHFNNQTKPLCVQFSSTKPTPAGHWMKSKEKKEANFYFVVRIPATLRGASPPMLLCLVLCTTVEWKHRQCDTGWWGGGPQQLNNDEIDVWQPLTGECQPICLSVSAERWMTLQPPRRWKYSHCCHVMRSQSSSLSVTPVTLQDITPCLNWISELFFDVCHVL